MWVLDWQPRERGLEEVLMAEEVAVESDRGHTSPGG
jgi:hypothetical protein